MRRYLLALTSVALIATSPAALFAQENDVTTTSIAEETTTVTKTPARTQFKEAVGLRNQTIADAKEAMQDKMSEARDAFKQKISEFKDKQKVTRLTNLDTKLNEINKRKTTQMSERLEKLTEILGRISTKGADLESQGENTTTLNTSITSAQTAIDTAKTKVDEQAAKDYVVDVTTETALRANASATLKQFRTDLTATHKSVVDAQVAVRKAFAELQKLVGTAVETATPTTTP